MQQATYENFITAHDKLKLLCRCKLSNIFLDSLNLREIIEKKVCFMYTDDKSLFLTIPRHEIYYDLLYISENEETLCKGLTGLYSYLSLKLPIRASIIGKEYHIRDTVKIFNQHGFNIIKKLLRMRIYQPKEKILDLMRPYAEEFRNYISFASKDDAQEILEILKQEFDVVGDNLPELSQIVRDIDSKHIIILRYGEEISALHYFQISRGTIHALYDVTRKEYRREGFFMALASFVNEYHSALGQKKLRVLGWRDATNPKLIKHAQKNNQNLDGIVIYNLLYDPPAVTE